MPQQGQSFPTKKTHQKCEDDGTTLVLPDCGRSASPQADSKLLYIQQPHSRISIVGDYFMLVFL